MDAAGQPIHVAQIGSERQLFGVQHRLLLTGFMLRLAVLLFGDQCADDAAVVVNGTDGLHPKEL